MYRFLLTRRWLGYAVLTVVLAAIMAALGNWQLHRYRLHSAMNARIDAAATATPVPVTQVATPGQRPPDSVAWTRVTATGSYDGSHQILARERTVNATVGFEVLTPLILADGTTVLVDRGWIPPASGGAQPRPVVPPVPTGTVTVTGRLHLPESVPGTPQPIDGYPQVRRISPALLAGTVQRPLLGGYILLDQQQPPADPAFVKIPSDRTNSWQNLGYVVQWWLFAAMTLFGYGWAARREAHPPDDRDATDRDWPEIASRPTDASRPDEAGHPNDAGQPDDAGPPNDAGQPNDARQPNEAGQPNDARQPNDAGHPNDARQPNDAGQPGDTRRNEPETAAPVSPASVPIKP